MYSLKAINDPKLIEPSQSFTGIEAVMKLWNFIKCRFQAEIKQGSTLSSCLIIPVPSPQLKETSSLCLGRNISDRRLGQIKELKSLDSLSWCQTTIVYLFPSNFLLILCEFHIMHPSPTHFPIPSFLPSPIATVPTHPKIK